MLNLVRSLYFRHYLYILISSLASIAILVVSNYLLVKLFAFAILMINLVILYDTLRTHYKNYTFFYKELKVLQIGEKLDTSLYTSEVIKNFAIEINRYQDSVSHLGNDNNISEDNLRYIYVRLIDIFNKIRFDNSRVKNSIKQLISMINGVSILKNEVKEYADLISAFSSENMPQLISNERNTNLNVDNLKIAKTKINENVTVLEAISIKIDSIINDFANIINEIELISLNTHIDAYNISDNKNELSIADRVKLFAKNSNENIFSNIDFLREYKLKLGEIKSDLDEEKNLLYNIDRKASDLSILHENMERKLNVVVILGEKLKNNFDKILVNIVDKANDLADLVTLNSEEFENSVATLEDIVNSDNSYKKIIKSN